MHCVLNSVEKICVFFSQISQQYGLLSSGPFASLQFLLEPPVAIIDFKSLKWFVSVSTILGAILHPWQPSSLIVMDLTILT